MRIIDKRHDYYDGIQYTAEPVWHRKEKTFMLDHMVKDELPANLQIMAMDAWKGIPVPDSIRIQSEHRTPMVLGLCGKLYAINIINQGFDPVKPFNDTKLFDVEVVKLGIKDDYVYRRNRWYSWNREIFNDVEWDRRFGSCDLTKLFYDLKTPLFSIMYERDYNDIVLSTNILLKPFKFQRMFGPWDIYQMIDIYLGNELACINNPDCIMTDELRRDAHGFDHWSFKKKGKNSKD